MKALGLVELCYTIANGGMAVITFYLLLLGLLGTSLLAVFSWLADWLQTSGAVMLVLLGSTIFALSPVMAGFLALFFAMSYGVQGLKKWGLPPNPTDAHEIIEKAGARDAGQVVANCGPLLAVLVGQRWLVSGQSSLAVTEASLPFLLAEVAVIAGVAADTWSSEIGVLSSKAPRSIVSGRKLASGLSGGVSLLGTMAGAGAAIIVAGLWWGGNQLFRPEATTCAFFWVPALAGFAATWIDSLLGGTVQQKYRCAICGKITEQRQHHGELTTKISGLPGFNNDTVNLLTGLLTLLLAFWLQGL